MPELATPDLIYLVQVCQSLQIWFANWWGGGEKELRFTVCLFFSHAWLSSLLLLAALVQLAKEQRLLLHLRYQTHLFPPLSCPIVHHLGAFCLQEVGVECLQNRSWSPRWSQQGLRIVNGDVQHLWRDTLDQLSSFMKHCNLLRWKRCI